VRFAAAQSALTEDGQSASAGGTGGATVTAISSHPRWLSRAPLIGAALAASLLAALLYGTGDGPGTGGRPDAQFAVDGAAADDARFPPVRVMPAPEIEPEPSVQVQEIQIAQGEDASVGLPESGPAESLEPSELAAPLPEIVVADEPAPALTPRAEASGRLELPTEVPDEGATTREPILLAMNISGPLLYDRPGDAIGMVRLGGLRTARPGLPRLDALVPAHVGRTLSESPFLYWYLSEDTDSPVEFVLNDRVSVDPLLALTFEPPYVAGIHALDLGEHGVVLEPGKEYRWFVSLKAEAGAASEDVIARGAILPIEPSADLKRALENASAGDQGRLYAERGLWYDALAFISAGIDRDPEDARLRELRAGLLEAGGLSEAAEHQRRASRPGATP
jgi:hypothetical protein